MSRTFALVAFLASAATVALLPAPVRAQGASPLLAGVWTLNRSLSELPPDIGFNPAWATAAPSGDSGSAGSSGGGGGGRGRRGSTGGAGGRTPATPFGRSESYDDSRRVQFLTGDARSPATRLMIVDSPLAVTLTTELGQSRVVHPDGREESIEIQGVTFGVTSKRDGDQLTIDYRVDQTREVRYIYSFTPNPSRLVVDVQFLERGKGDKARRIYDAGTPTETVAPAAARGAAPAGAPGQPASGQPAPESFDQRPGAEFKGLTSLGLLVENLSTQSVACGLSQDAIESALSKKLTAAGFTVRRNSDEDTYVYVNIQTSTVAGTCVSRYDAFLYTQATSRLSYTTKPVLVQVSLIHRGGIGTSVAAGHGTAVVRGLEGYVDVFITQIRDANK